MAKKKEKELTAAEIERNISNKESEVQREKEKAAKKYQADKQRRLRENMKAAGLKQVLTWDCPIAPALRESMEGAGFHPAPAWEKSLPHKRRPLPPGVVKIAISIRETSLDIANKNPEVRDAIDTTLYTFLNVLEKSGLAREVWVDIYKDFQELLKPLGRS
jgi:hypothetical protein